MVEHNDLSLRIAATGTVGTLRTAMNDEARMPRHVADPKSSIRAGTSTTARSRISDQVGDRHARVRP